MTDQDAKGSFCIIMEKVPDEKQADAALFLSGCFSLPQKSTRGIAASGPVALVAGINRRQADAIMAELAQALPQSVTLRIADSEERNVSRLQWPHSPRIYGRELDDFGEEAGVHDVRCPVCGNMLRITSDGNALRASMAVERRRGDTTAHSAPTADTDPLFSGIKPLAAGTSGLASIRSLEAGDTGFWADFGKNALQPAIPDPSPPPAGSGGDSAAGSRRTGDRTQSGMSAFMKPGVFAVIVSRTRDAQAVKAVAEIMGISEAEARDKALSLGLCVARNIALEEAQALLAKFRNFGAKARIVKPM